LAPATFNNRRFDSLNVKEEPEEKLQNLHIFHFINKSTTIKMSATTPGTSKKSVLERFLSELEWDAGDERHF
jgi:hypothetical protein